jgi:DNA polymerase-3 subunit delta'
MFRPFEAKRRVVIIDDADALGPAGQNALLKTLEEPRPTSIFILITSRPDSLLDTVRSRCAIMRFAQLSPSDIAAVLQREHGYTQRDSQAVAAAAEGSVGQALAARAGDLTEAREVAESILLQSQKRPDARSRLEWAKGLSKGSGSAASERDNLAMQLQVFASLVRDVALLRSGARGALLANADRKQTLEAVAKSLTGDRAVGVFAAIDRAVEALEGNVSSKVVADWIMLQL